MPSWFFFSTFFFAVKPFQTTNTLEISLLFRDKCFIFAR